MTVPELLLAISILGVIIGAIIGSRRLLGWSLVAGIVALVAILFTDDDEQSRRRRHWGEC
jgi:hypothetical protein